MKTIKMNLTKLLWITVLIGISSGHVHRTRRERADMKPMLKDEEGTPIMGMYYVEEPPTSRTDPQPCQVQLNSVTNDYDYTCGCNQQIGMDRPIGHLILNLTGCDLRLAIFWSELEAGLSPKAITFVGVTLTLTGQTVNETVDSSMKKLTFANSSFADLNEDAFLGLKALEELRFFDCKFKSISKYAIRNHDNLNTIEFIESIIGEIIGNAFSNLPAIEDFAISFSTIGDIKVQGINLHTVGETFPCNRTSKNLDLDESLKLLETCMDSVIGHKSRSVHDFINDLDTSDTHTSDTVMARQILGARDTNLPPFGNRFLLYQNKISIIRSNAVDSNAFGFLILGGNQIEVIKPTAFNMQLQNPCQISAALFASNNITKLSNQAFAGIRNNKNSNYTTHIALNKNKFEEVKAQSFQIEKGIQIFSVDENIFECDCMKLSGFLRDQQPLTDVQAELKMQVIDKANCTNGIDLKTFKDTCDEFATEIPDNTRKLTPTPPSGSKTSEEFATEITEQHRKLTTPSSGSKKTFSHSNLINVIVTGFVMIFITKIIK